MLYDECWTGYRISDLASRHGRPTLACSRRRYAPQLMHDVMLLSKSMRYASEDLS